MFPSEDAASWTFFHYWSSSESSFSMLSAFWEQDPDHNTRRGTCAGSSGHVQLKRNSNNFTLHQHSRPLPRVRCRPVSPWVTELCVSRRCSQLGVPHQSLKKVIFKKGSIRQFHLQRANLLMKYMQTKRDPNYCAVLMKISFPRIYSGETASML